jgi:hypothetical protein
MACFMIRAEGMGFRDHVVTSSVRQNGWPDFTDDSTSGATQVQRSEFRSTIRIVDSSPRKNFSGTAFPGKRVECAAKPLRAVVRAKQTLGDSVSWPRAGRSLSRRGQRRLNPVRYSATPYLVRAIASPSF